MRNEKRCGAAEKTGKRLKLSASEAHEKRILTCEPETDREPGTNSVRMISEVKAKLASIAERGKTRAQAAHQNIRQEIRWFKRRWRRIVGGKQSEKISESNSPLICLLMFAWNQVPVVCSNFRRWFRAKKDDLRKSWGTMLLWLSRHRIHPAAFLGAGCTAASVLLFTSFYTMGTTVTYDGEVIAVLPSEEAAEEVRSDIEQITAKALKTSFTIDDSLIQYSSELMRREDVGDKESYKEELSAEIGLVTTAYSLYINGEFLGATPYEGALEELLAQLGAAASDENTISCTFEDEIEIRQEMVPNEKIVNLGHLAETLYSTKEEEVTYEVKKGDTWSEIAQAHGLTANELLALNPGYNINKLQIGEVLTLSASAPYLTMTLVKQERYVEDLIYDVIFTDTADLYQGDDRVTSPGEYGKADVVANVTYVNGTETERTVLSSVTLKNPVDEHRLRGTTPRPTWYPTGSFRWPTTGRITSYFGGRSSPGGVGSTNHKGLDIANSKGTAIYAADGGVVSYAGWMSGYGYLVKIDHLNGYVTYYGHNSRLLVSVGSKVYKGQQIARMGSTGNSTGNHCHFEIRYNGSAKNPLNFLP